MSEKIETPLRIAEITSVLPFPNLEDSARKLLEGILKTVQKNQTRIAGCLVLVLERDESGRIGFTHDLWSDDSMPMNGAVATLAVRLAMRMEANYLHELLYP